MEAKRCAILRIYVMRYEWDDRKNRQNQLKHDGIPFEMPALVFMDAACVVATDRTDASGEQRWHAIGTARIAGEAVAVLLVVHAYGEDIDGEEVIRIVSARRAEKHEVRRYREQAVEWKRARGTASGRTKTGGRGRFRHQPARHSAPHRQTTREYGSPAGRKAQGSRQRSCRSPSARLAEVQRRGTPDQD